MTSKWESFSIKLMRIKVGQSIKKRWLISWGYCWTFRKTSNSEMLQHSLRSEKRLGHKCSLLYRGKYRQIQLWSPTQLYNSSKLCKISTNEFLLIFISQRMLTYFPIYRHPQHRVTFNQNALLYRNLSYLTIWFYWIELILSI